MSNGNMRSAAAFRKTEELTLPSGLTVDVKRPDASRLVMEAPEDKVPAFLVSQYSEALGLDNAFSEVPKESPQEALRKTSLFMDIVVRAAVRWPVISDNPTTDDEIAISDFEMIDRKFLFTWVMNRSADSASE